MTFVPVNGLPILIGMMFDMNFEWQNLSKFRGVAINEETNTKIIVDDLLNHSITEDEVFEYMLCQFKVAALRRLYFSLPKSSFSPKRVEFVGINIGIKHNMPSKRKHELIKTWPKPRDIRTLVAFIEFGMFYQKWIPYYEVKVKALRLITNTSNWDTKMTKELWPQEDEDSWKIFILEITSNPCLFLWDSRQRCYVQNNFCQIGMGFICMQPSNDDVLMDVMVCEMAGGDCEFTRDPPKDIPNQIMTSLTQFALELEDAKDMRQDYTHTWKKDLPEIMV